MTDYKKVAESLWSGLEDFQSLYPIQDTTRTYHLFDLTETKEFSSQELMEKARTWTQTCTLPWKEKRTSG